MRTALLLMSGSRGDHEPLFALTMAMLNSGKFSNIHVAVQPDYQHLVPNDRRVIPHILPVSMNDYRTVFINLMQKSLSMTRKNGQKPKLQQGSQGDAIVVQTKCLSTVMKRNIAPSISQLFQIAVDAQPNVILATTLIASTAATIAEYLDIPMWLVNLQPNTPTESYPFLMSNGGNAKEAARLVAHLRKSSPAPTDKLANLRSYSAQEKMHHNLLHSLNTFRSSKRLRKLERSDLNAILKGKKSNMYILNSFPEPLVPRSPDWSSNVYLAPSLADNYLPPQWNPEKSCPKLTKYLATRPAAKPFVVNFGSMSVRHPDVITRAIFTALRAVNMQRVLVVKGNADIGAHNLSAEDRHDFQLIQWAKKHVYVTDEAPQNAWLMPRCSGVLCHGGAGTMAAALRAGLPIVIAPHLCDQFFWAELCQQLGVGAVAQPGLSSATSETFERAFRSALNEQTKNRAANMGKRIRELGNGPAIAAELVATVGQKI